MWPTYLFLGKFPSVFLGTASDTEFCTPLWLTENGDNEEPARNIDQSDGHTNPLQERDRWYVSKFWIALSG